MAKANINSVRPYMGVNLLEDPSLLKEDEAVRTENLCYLPSGEFGKRLGIGPTTIRTVDGGVANNLLIPSFERAGVDAIFTTTTMSGVTEDGRQTVLVVGGGVSLGGLTAAVATPRRPMLVEVGDLVFVALGGALTQNKIVTRPFIGSDGIAVTNFSFAGTGNSELYPGVIIPYRQRVAYFNFGSGFENFGVMSDNRNLATSVNQNFETVGNSAKSTRSFIVGSRGGDRIVGGTEIALAEVGTPNSSALLVLREYSAYLLTGELAQTTDAGSYFGDLEVNRINIDCGCASNETITNTPYGVFWAGHDDVWFLQEGRTPIAVGTKIRPALTASPAADRWQWFAAYHDGIYRLAIQSPNGVDLEQWWLDLRNGVPRNFREARWFGPMTYKWQRLQDSAGQTGCFTMAPERRANRPSALYTVLPVTAPSFGGDPTQNCGLVQYDTTAGHDRSLQVTQGVPIFAGGLVRTGGNLVTATFDALNPHGFETGDIVNLDNLNLANIEGNFPAGQFVITRISDLVFTYVNIGANVTSGITHSFRKEGVSSFATVADASIQTMLISRELDFGDPMIDKLVTGVEINAFASVSAIVQPNVLLNGGDSTVPLNGNAVSDVPGEILANSRFRLDIDLLDATSLTTRKQSIGLFPPSTSRPVGSKLQLKLNDLPGYVVTEEMTTLKFFTGNRLVGPFTTRTATFTPQCFTDIRLFLNYVIAQCTAAVPGSNWAFHQLASENSRQVLLYPTSDTEVTFIFGNTGFLTSGVLMTLTDAEDLSNRLWGAMLGYNTLTDRPYDPGTLGGFNPIPTDYAVAWRSSAQINYGGIFLRVQPQRRRPK